MVNLSHFEMLSDLRYPKDVLRSREKALFSLSKIDVGGGGNLSVLAAKRSEVPVTDLRAYISTRTIP